jgi:cytochrome c-type biogenesis protein CcmE
MSDLDLSPRSAGAPSVRSRKRRWAPLVVLALVLVAGGVLITQFLRSAVDYYCNVDEIGQRSGCEPGRRLRVQGTVDRGSVVTDAGVTTFTISFAGASLPVRYDGQPGGIFEECQPVVVHGELTNGTFEGDRIEVKHSNEYEAENAERLDAAPAESTSCSQPA